MFIISFQNWIGMLLRERRTCSSIMPFYKAIISKIQNSIWKSPFKTTVSSAIGIDRATQKAAASPFPWILTLINQYFVCAFFQFFTYLFMFLWQEWHGNIIFDQIEICSFFVYVCRNQNASHKNYGLLCVPMFGETRKIEMYAGFVFFFVFK